MINDRCVRKLVLSCFILLQVNFVTLAQDLTDLHWRFGNTSQALDFNKGDFQPIVIDDQATPFGLGGGVTISDPITGDLWFYTDGANVYDGSNRITPGGAGLGGDPSLNQAAVACPVPGTTSQFYIFTNPGSGGANEIRFSVADKNLTGNASAAAPTLGDISQLNQATGLTTPAEAMVVIPGPNRQRFWLLSQNRTTGDYVVYEVSTAGFGTTNTFNFFNASNPTAEAAAFGVHIFAPDSIIIAVAPKTGNRNIQLLRFDANLGTLTFERQILNTGVNDGSGQSIYDVEWSNDGTKLYYSRHGGNNALTGQLHQFDFDSLQRSNSIAGGYFRSFGLKKGPDQRIYHLYQAANSGPFSIGRVNQPDSLPDSTAYQAQIPDFGDALGRQFPATSTSAPIVFNMSFNIFGFCQNTPTMFSPSVEPTPQFVTWDYGDGGGSQEYAPIYTYQNPGPYTVTLTAFLNGQSQSTTQVLNIIDNQLELTHLTDTTICPGETLQRNALPSGQQGNYSFLWSTGETTQLIEIDSAGTYWAQVTDLTTGCPAFASFEVTVYGNDEQKANIWYFGEQAGIDFNEAPPVALTDENLMSSPEGCAAISDRNGDLLFYTNGRTVWNKDHEIMLNGMLIGGDSTSAQSSIILPIPDNETLFYIITTDQVYGDRSYNMRFSVVDMKQDLARGAVIIKDRPLFTNSSEKLAATGVGGGTTWLFGHEYGNNNYRAYPITTTGIGNARVTSVGKTLSFAEELNGRGTMKVSPTGSLIGSVIPGAENFLELVNFDAANGTFTSPLLIDLEEPAPSEAYGLEFSSGGARVYVTTTGANSKLFQYNLDSLLNASVTYSDDSVVQFIEQSKFELSSGTGYGSLQIGPDQVIYMAKDNSGNLSTIANSNGDEVQAGYNDQGFDLDGRISRLGLPNFAQNILNPPQDPSITVDGGCVGQPTRFTATGTSDIDEFAWNFGDGAQALGPDTTHVYQQVGTFNVTLNITNRCGLDTTLVQTVVINPTPEQPIVPSAVAICDDNGVVLTAWPQDDPGLTYTWSTGETTREITVLQPSTITIFITNAAGCRSDTLTTLVGDQRPIVDFGPDQIICAGEELDPLDAQNPGATYTWAINGAGTGNTGRFQDIDTSVAGDFEYAVSIFDVNGCQTTNRITYTILEAPQPTVTPFNASGCSVADGALKIDVPGSFSYSYTISSNNGTNIIQNRPIDGPFTDSIPNLPAGSYRVTVSNTVNGCTTTLGAVGINSNNPSFTITSAEPNNGCDDGNITITASAPGNYSYRVIDFSTGIDATTGSFTASTSTVTGNIPFGTYTIEMTNTADGCLQTRQNVVVEQAPTAEFNFDPIQTDCGTSGTISVRPVTGNVKYTWTDPNGAILTDTTSSVSISQSGVYTVTSSGTGLCPQTEQIQFFLSEDPEGSIAVSGDPCNGELTLTAALTSGENPNDYIFGWSNGASSASTVVNRSGSYAVTIRNRNSGCFVTVDTTVQVENVLEVTLIQEPDCDNETQVILTAQSNIPAQVTFEWTGPDGTILPETTASISTGLGGFYQVTVRGIDNSCEASADLNVSVVPIFDSEISLPATLTFCSEDPANGTVVLDPGIFNTYEWRKLPSLDIISVLPTYAASEPGTYEVTFSNGSICRTARVVVTDDCRPRIFAPNAFSPDGRGLPQNEAFYVFPNPYVTDFTIFIYNRWGVLVYQSNSIDFRWNGYFNGSPLPVGTYAYVMRYKSNLDATNETFEQRGGVTLVK
ncbi:MAG: PKD domain-containing protein [Imperialibacter sp.]|uniref:PKD domain-containing protein n=1 Tax=Imperialibacter sp. TaxID=2038411 RepID=UPI0032EF85E5